MADGNDNSDRQLMADLLGYYLGIADQEGRARVEAAFEGDDDALTAAQEKMHRLLQPLDADPPPVPPANFVAGILDRVAEAKNILPLRRPEPARVPAATVADGTQGSRGRPLLALREVVGLAAAILIFVGLFVPGYQNARTIAWRNACADNLRQIGNGFVTYAEANEGNLPYPGPLPDGARWGQTVGGTANGRGNSPPVYQLIRQQLVAPKAMTCPVPGTPGYSFPLPVKPLNKNRAEPGTPLSSDWTPLLDPRGQIIPADQAARNSNSHGRSAGQNVLHIRLNVHFYRTPNVGLEHDDIYRVFGVEQYTGLERPVLKTDAFLIP